MALLTLVTIAGVVNVLNRSHYLQQYKCAKLPRLPFLVLLMALPLAVVDKKITDWHLHAMWLTLLAIGILLSFIDRERHLLPDRLVLPLIPLALLLAAISGRFGSALLGGVSWSALFALLALINPTGLGWGDAKFAAPLGVACGALSLRLVPLAALLGLVAGSIYALTLMASGHRHRRIPFGPFMLAGAIASLISLG